jgi:hypothetical protein
MMSSVLGRSVTRPMAAAVGDGDATAYFNAWIAAGDRLVAAAGEALIVLRFSASELCLRASSSLPTSYHPLGEPVDARLVSAFRSKSPRSTKD